MPRVPPHADPEDSGIGKFICQSPTLIFTFRVRIRGQNPLHYPTPGVGISLFYCQNCHNCNNPMGGMSESCQSPLDCLWTPPEIHNDWNIKVELNAKMICLDKKIKYVCVWPLDGVLQDGHNFILKWVCMLKPLSHSSKNYFRNLVHILGLNNLIMLFIKIWILT